MVVLTDGEIFLDPLNLTTVISSTKMQGVECFAIGVRAGSRGCLLTLYKGGARVPGRDFCKWLTKPCSLHTHQLLFSPPHVPGTTPTPTEAHSPSVGIAHLLSSDGESSGNTGSPHQGGMGGWSQRRQW